MPFQPDIVAIKARGDQNRIAAAAIDLEKIIEQHMPLIELLVCAGAPLAYVAEQDYAIMDSVTQLYSPRLNAFFLRNGARMSPDFEAALPEPDRAHIRRALEEGQRLCSETEENKTTHRH